MKQKKIPLRMCVGCREMKPKRELLRIVKSKEGEISLDTTGKKAGRGAYICKEETCFKKAQKQRQLERAFECPIGEQTYNDLLNLLLEEGNDTL